MYVCVYIYIYICIYNGAIKFTTAKSKVMYHWSVVCYWCATLIERMVAEPIHMVEHHYGESALTEPTTLAKLGHFLTSSNCQKLIDTAKEANKHYGVAESGGAIPVLPAEGMEGTWHESMVIEPARDSDGRVKALDAEYNTLEPALAGACGPNITGARPPIDITHGCTIKSAMSRHMCAVIKTLTLADGSQFDVHVDKSSQMLEKNNKYREMAERRMTREHKKLMAEHLKEFGLNGVKKPSKVPCERFEEMYGEVASKVNAGEWGNIKAMVNAVCFCKKERAGLGPASFRCLAAQRRMHSITSAQCLL